MRTAERAPLNSVRSREIEPEVKTVWLGRQKEEAWRKAYAEMRAKEQML